MKTKPAARSRRPHPIAPAPAPAYPRPLLQRDNWVSLDGMWECGIDEKGDWQAEGDVRWGKQILVPFAPETPASGIGFEGYLQAVWYRRTFDAPQRRDEQRVILHFNAVDYAATVWLNGKLAARHEGGYTPFHADVTDLLEGDGPQTLVVCAKDDPHDMAKPRGKQDWLPTPHSIWYLRTSGVWQSVWLEVVPRTRVGHLRWSADVAKWEIALDARLEGPAKLGMKLRVTLTARGATLADETFSVHPSPFLGPGQVVSRKIVLDDPGIGDGREFLLWWPHRPTLIDVAVTLLDENGAELDVVRSYTAMRTVSLQAEKFILNGVPYKLMMLLDQGYWPETGLTAPDDAALRRDVELVKAMGFNGVRKHQKIENPRFLFWADALGLCVWEEMPSAYTFTPQTVERVAREWAAAIERDCSHPCIVAWVPVNESWGVPDLPDVAAQRHFVQSLYYMTKSLDPTRPVIGNDGWEMVVTDILAIHDYDKDPLRLTARYALKEGELLPFLRHARPGGRALVLGDGPFENRPAMLTEFGGIAYSKGTDGTWGYSRAESASEFARQYHDLLKSVRAVSLFEGFCYTQFTDTYQEANGLLYMDRTPKFPIEQIAVATRGAQTAAEEKIEKQFGKAQKK